MKLSKKQKIVATLTLLILMGVALLIAFGKFPPEDLSGKLRLKNQLQGTSSTQAISWPTDN